MLIVDPVRLARRQLEIDRDRTARFPHLLDHKKARMKVSPLAWLRGSAPLFYELLKQHPTLTKGPPGEGWLVGDAHVENFGAYRAGALSMKETEAAHAKEDIVFDLNDFDDAFIGPFRLDVLRLLTSVILGGREAGTDGGRTLELCDALLDAYGGALFKTRKKAFPRPPVVTALVDLVRGRTRKALLDARTHVVGAERRFTLGDHYEAIPKKLREKAERAFEKYTRRLPKAESLPADAIEVVDAAFRIAGTGSLGALRIALLVRGKGGPDGAFIFDMKAQGEPSAAGLVRPPKLAPAERVCSALGACLQRPPRMIGATRLRGSSMFVRRLMPQEDKIDLSRVAAPDLEPLVRHFGALLGAAHRRGAVRVPKTPWAEVDRVGLVERAVALAGMHEAMYLAYCLLCAHPRTR
jgi:uncharacterized protein (DUF2252 family)